MSWAANEWKDGLPHKALRAIEEMEKNLEWLKKERTQRQYQFDTLEQVIVQRYSFQIYAYNF